MTGNVRPSGHFHRFALTLAFLFVFLSAFASALAKDITLYVSAWGNIEEHRALAAEYSRRNPNVEVVFQEAPGSYWDSVVVNVAAGVGPDVYFTQEMLTVEYVANGAFLPLNYFIESDPEFSMDDLFPGLFDSFTWEGQIGAVPIVTYASVMYYNQRLFDLAGVPYPHGLTWDDVPEMARKLTRRDAAGEATQYGFHHRLGEVNFILPFLWQNGGGIVSQDGRKSLLNTEGTRGAVQFLYDLVWTHKVAPTGFEYHKFGFADHQNLAVFTEGSWNIDVWGKLTDLDFGIARLPAGPVSDIAMAYPNGYAISRASRHPEAAWDFIKWVVSLEGQTIVAEGSLGIPVHRRVAPSSAYLGGPTADKRAVAAEALVNARAPWVVPGIETDVTNPIVKPHLWEIMDNLIPVNAGLAEADRLTQQYLDRFWANQ